MSSLPGILLVGVALLASTAPTQPAKSPPTTDAQATPAPTETDTTKDPTIAHAAVNTQSPGEALDNLDPGRHGVRWLKVEQPEFYAHLEAHPELYRKALASRIEDAVSRVKEDDTRKICMLLELVQYVQGEDIAQATRQLFTEAHRVALNRYHDETVVALGYTRYELAVIVRSHALGALSRLNDPYAVNIILEELERPRAAYGFANGLHANIEYLKAVAHHRPDIAPRILDIVGNRDSPAFGYKSLVRIASDLQKRRLSSPAPNTPPRATNVNMRWIRDGIAPEWRPSNLTDGIIDDLDRSTPYPPGSFRWISANTAYTGYIAGVAENRLDVLPRLRKILENELSPVYESYGSHDLKSIIADLESLAADETTPAASRSKGAASPVHLADPEDNPPSADQSGIRRRAAFADGLPLSISVRRYQVARIRSSNPDTQAREAQDAIRTGPRKLADYTVLVTALPWRENEDHDVRRVKLELADDAPDYYEECRCVLYLDQSSLGLSEVRFHAEDRYIGRGSQEIRAFGEQRWCISGGGPLPIDWAMGEGDLDFRTTYAEVDVPRDPGCRLTPCKRLEEVKYAGRRAIKMTTELIWDNGQPHRKVEQIWVPEECWWRSFKSYAGGKLELEAEWTGKSSQQRRHGE